MATNPVIKVHNLYDGDHVDMKKQEEYAYKRARKEEERFYVHYHKFTDKCDGSTKKHKWVTPETIKEEEEEAMNGGGN